MRSICPFVLYITFSIGLFCISCQTTTDAVQLSLGNEYAKQGLLREAIDQYRKVLTTNPENVAANRNIGIMLVKSGDYQNARRYLEFVSQKIPRDFDVNFYLGEICRAESRFGDAVYYYQQGLRTKPNDDRALKSLAWSFFKMRYYAEALSNANKLLEQGPRDGQAAIIATRIFIKLKRFDEALATVQASLPQADKALVPYLKSLEGDIFLSRGNPDQAKMAYSIALKEAPLTASALFGMGRIMILSHDHKRGALYLERALRIRPDLLEAHYLLGSLLAKSNPLSAKKHLEIFTKLAATDPDFISEVEASRKILRASK